MAAGGMEVGVDRETAIDEHLPRGRAYRVPDLRRFGRDAAVHLVAHVRKRVEALGLVAAPILDREGPGDHRLRPQRRQLVRPPGTHLGTDRARHVALERY